MKLIKMSFDGLKMFKSGRFELDLYASDKVPTDDESVYRIQPPLYTNKVIALAGINASGKTCALELLRFALHILNGLPLNGGVWSSIADLFCQGPVFTAVFWAQDSLYVLRSKLQIERDALEEDPLDCPLLFEKETLYRWNGGTITKKALADADILLTKCRQVLSREDPSSYSAGDYISPSVSIFAACFPERTRVALVDAGPGRMLKSRPSNGECALHVLDSNVEYLRRSDDDSSWVLKLRSDEKPQMLNVFEIRHVLSSGTLRGLDIIDRLIPVLASGGYLLVDEIENSLNKQLVNVVIDLFSTSETNPKGATLIFSTHYPEVLDQVHRKDDVYFLVRDDNHKTKVLKYSNEVKRIENKKSEVFISNFVKGTAPKYADVRELRNFIKDRVRDA